MTTDSGRAATQPYRVRVGGVWYWVDPTVPREAIEPGDTVIMYAGGEAHLAVLDSAWPKDQPDGAAPVMFSALQGGRFELPARDIAAVHLAAVDEQQ